MRDILFEKIAVLAEDELDCGYVAVHDGKIAYIGKAAPAEFSHARVIDGTNKVLMPGLINTHTHIPMTLMRGYADDYNLQEWLTQHIFPAEDRLDEKSVRIGTELGIAEMLASGTTSFSDSYFFSESVAQAVFDSKIKANIARSVTNFDTEVELSAFYGTREELALYEKWHGADAGRIQIDAAIHAEYTTSASLWSALGSFAKEKGIVMQVHLSETRKEQDDCVKKYGKTPTRLFYDAGVFDAKTIAAHCVWLTDEDMDILKGKQVTVAHNPVSNLKLASGIARVPKMLASGINVSLGTDGVASNNSFDMFEEMKMAALLHKGNLLDPTVLCAREALRLATENGALAQGRECECGKIEVGYDADLVMVDLDKPHLMPCHHVVSNLVYAARGSDVCMTMVRGEILYENGAFPTLDIERIRFELENVALPKVFGKR